MKIICQLLIFTLTITQSQAQQDQYSWKYLGSTGLPYSLTDPEIEVSSNGIPHIMRYYFSTEVLKWADTAWVQLGYSNIGLTSHADIEFNSCDTPYVAYNDQSRSDAIRVRKFDGDRWWYVGMKSFTPPLIASFALAISPSDEVYVAYSDSPNDEKITVKKNVDTNWVTVGESHFSQPADDLDFEISSDGILYILFRNTDNQKLSVMRYDVISWEYFGNQDFASAQRAPDMCISQEGTVYVAFADNDNSYQAHVLKSDGGDWTDVGETVISGSFATDFSMMLNSNGDPVVGFDDYQNGRRPTVLQFDGQSWTPIGAEGFSSDTADSPVFAIGPDDKVFCTFWEYTLPRTLSVMTYDSVYTGINENVSAYFKILPNPVTKNAIIDMSGIPGEIEKIECYDLKGNCLLKKEHPEKKAEINLSDLPDGSYLIKVITRKNQYMGRIVKRR